MREVRIGPTNDRRVLGVMNEFALHGEALWKEGGLQDLGALSLRLASLTLGPLHHRSGSPDRELAAVVGSTEPLATVIAFPSPAAAHPAPTASEKGASAYQFKVTLLDTKPDPESFDPADFADNLRNGQLARFEDQP